MIRMDYQTLPGLPVMVYAAETETVDEEILDEDELYELELASGSELPDYPILDEAYAIVPASCLEALLLAVGIIIGCLLVTGGIHHD